MATRNNTRTPSVQVLEDKASENTQALSEAYKTFLEAQHKNVESFTAAQQETLKAAEKTLEMNYAFMQQRLDAINDFFRSFTSRGLSLRERAELQARSTKDSVATYVNHAQEMTQVWDQTRQQVTDIIHKRLKNYGEEVRGQVAKSK